MKWMAMVKLLLAAGILLILLARPWLQLQARQCFVCCQWHIFYLVSIEIERCQQLNCRQFEVDNW